ncbi:MAG: AbrB/MazE/SpoVT family DNA-binding domain-containing protein [Fimbriimonadaceae bacterium]|nr:AbrB/MazE/SpoVT family DNA-binding domain-containing protein [Fimbriimonadaceae bacterium]
MYAVSYFSEEALVNISELFYGSVTVGERGQVVIPAEARTEMGIKPGDKLLVMRDPFHKCLSIGRIDRMRELLDEFELAYQRFAEEHQGAEPE